MRLAVAPTGSGKNTDDLLWGTEQLADQLSVSYHHTTKVIAALDKMGVVDTVRGRNGGVRLAPSALGMSVGHIVRALEGSGDVVNCEGDRSGKNPCPLRGGCRLRGALALAQEAFFASLDAVTVVSIIDPPTRQVLLSLGTSPN